MADGDSPTATGSARQPTATLRQPPARKRGADAKKPTRRRGKARPEEETRPSANAEKHAHF